NAIDARCDFLRGQCAVNYRQYNRPTSLLGADQGGEFEVKIGFSKKLQGFSFSGHLACGSKVYPLEPVDPVGNDTHVSTHKIDNETLRRCEALDLTLHIKNDARQIDKSIQAIVDHWKMWSPDKGLSIDVFRHGSA